MPDEPRLPPDLDALHRTLDAVRFEPRASLGPELLGRVRQGEDAARLSCRRPWRPRVLAAAAAVLVLAAGGTVVALHYSGSVTVDHCCFDLDGGGDADDGVRVVAERDAAVHRLQVYEDRDGSRALSAGDYVRLDRGGAPVMGGDVAERLVTTRHCCVDLDGGGPDDDALLVIGVPPDRVVMAAIYERRGEGRRQRTAAALRLR
jgi:hypothetical protein